MLGRIAVALEGTDVLAMAGALWRQHLWAGWSTPYEIDVNSSPVEPTADWLERYGSSDLRVMVDFDTTRKYYLYSDPKTRIVKAAFDVAGGPKEVVELLGEVPFEVASFEARYGSWSESRSPYGRRPSFGGYHFEHGWAAAFRGDGHSRLVSRRWLEHGPWQLLRGPNNTTLVQFHGLDLDAELAFAQAWPAHQRIGISAEGGYLQDEYVYQNELEGFYLPDRRVLEVLVIGRTVSPREMRDAAAVRRDQALGPERPVDNVAFVFLDPAEATPHLPELWRYGLECWTILNEVKTRLDTDEPPEGVDAG